ncbi:hypothetical protein [Paraburkholderia antibiotica]|uniref:Uncharacterized protein n=1 Tax=Paraburkholderia antibiotica TaxID=2728839 RepID=A0A7X9X5S0_9BURK|nr:hypothetical protein [Paraburkholderia antibiotica]NML31951.1 hypothetical protein [Paraburkholderia antibiotica]
MDASGNIVPDLESQSVVRRMLISRAKFFSDNGLLTVDAFDKSGKLIDRQYFKNDFTEEGLALCRRKVPAWMSSKGSKKDPPDMKLLEKALAEIRAGK